MRPGIWLFMPVTREKFKTYKNVFDNFTDRNIFKLSSQGHFDQMGSPLFIGKESNVFTALKDNKQVIVKIYRLETCDFNRMYDYIKYDPRYLGLKKQRRKIIFAWTQREYRNLMKAREAGVRVPTPYTCLYNILVMELIGHDSASPMLKNSMPSTKEKLPVLNIIYDEHTGRAGMVTRLEAFLDMIQRKKRR